MLPTAYAESAHSNITEHSQDILSVLGGAGRTCKEISQELHEDSTSVGRGLQVLATKGLAHKLGAVWIKSEWRPFEPFSAEEKNDIGRESFFDIN